MAGNIVTDGEVMRLLEVETIKETVERETQLIDNTEQAIGEVFDRMHSGSIDVGEGSLLVIALVKELAAAATEIEKQLPLPQGDDE